MADQVSSPPPAKKTRPRGNKMVAARPASRTTHQPTYRTNNPPHPWSMSTVVALLKELTAGASSRLGMPDATHVPRARVKYIAPRAGIQLLAFREARDWLRKEGPLLAELGTSRVFAIAPVRYYNQHELMTEPLQICTFSPQMQLESYAGCPHSPPA
jgi:hypothetical protein